MYFVYILTNRSKTLYVGVTNSLLDRVAQHKAGESDFTNRYTIDALVYFECFQYVRNAIAREKQIKKYRRIKKLALISSMNPMWRDLSADYGKEYVDSYVANARRTLLADSKSSSSKK